MYRIAVVIIFCCFLIGIIDLKSKVKTSQKSSKASKNHGWDDKDRRIPIEEYQKKARLLNYNYTFESRTLISEGKSTLKETLVETLNLTYAFELLHYDSHGKILARYRLLKCISGNCQYKMPDVYVDFIQGGNNLKGLYVGTVPGSANSSKPQWNPLFSIIHSIVTPAISGAGDRQKVLTPYGWCNYYFSKPQDMVFKRNINHCNFDGVRNYSLIDGITIQKYEQSLVYLQNKKIDADITTIRGDETMQIRSVIDKQSMLRLRTEVKMQIVDRELEVTERKCSRELLAGECAEQVYGAINLGSNWKQITQAMTIGVRKRRSKLINTLNNVLSSGNEDSFGPVFNGVLFSTEQELIQAINTFKDTTILPILMDAMGLTGTQNAHNAIRKTFNDSESSQLIRYLRALALTTKINPELTTDLSNWMNELADDSDLRILRTQLEYTTANLYRRFCSSDSSILTQCQNGKIQEINDFVAMIINCSTFDCHSKAMNILGILPLPSIIPYAMQFVCSKSNESAAIQFEALKLLGHFDPKYFDKEMASTLLKIFDNTCTMNQALTDQTLAIDILLNLVLKFPIIATQILRSESINPDSHEKWAYFYASLAQRRSINHEIDAFWRQMRSFRVFRPNYAHRSLSATSSADAVTAGAIDGHQLTAMLRSAHDHGTIEWGDFALDLSTGKQTRTSLIQMMIKADGLAENEMSQADDEPETSSPHVVAQLAIAGSLQPPMTIVDGQSDLLSIIWNADGQSFPINDANLISRQYYGYIPLLSGFSITLDIFGKLRTRLTGSTTISIWSHNANMQITANVSGTLDMTIQLVSGNGTVGSVSSSALARTAIVAQFDGDFGTVPQQLCTIVSQLPIEIRRSYTLDSNKTGKRRIWHKKLMPGYCLKLSGHNSAMCALMQHLIAP